MCLTRAITLSHIIFQIYELVTMFRSLQLITDPYTCHYSSKWYDIISLFLRTLWSKAVNKSEEQQFVRRFIYRNCSQLQHINIIEVAESSISRPAVRPQTTCSLSSEFLISKTKWHYLYILSLTSYREIVVQLLGGSLQNFTVSLSYFINKKGKVVPALN
jgi:hypothetical protein